MQGRYDTIFDGIIQYHKIFRKSILYKFKKKKNHIIWKLQKTFKLRFT